MEDVLNLVRPRVVRTGQVISWFLSLPIHLLANAIVWFRAYRYDPEKIVCPACGFKGDRGTEGKTCRVQFVRVLGNDRGYLRHSCFRCGCDEIYSPLIYTGTKWLPPVSGDRVKDAAQKGVL